MIFRFIILGLLIIQGTGFSGLKNPGFEEGDPNNSSEFTPPAGWEYMNYAALHESFTPIPHDTHRDPDAISWSIPGPSQGSSFLVLSTGDTEGLGTDPPTVSSAWVKSSEFILSSGSTIYLSYIFATCDWYSDFCTISLIPSDPNAFPNTTQVITLLSANVNDIENRVTPPDIPRYGISGGWQTLSYTIGPNEAGAYRIKCLVTDISDSAYNSYLAVDGIHYCNPSASFGDINLDCQIDLSDFSLLASAWLTICSDDPNSPYYDPNVPCDPNIPTCESDLDRDWTVDSGDLGIMSDHWLEDFWSE